MDAEILEVLKAIRGELVMLRNDFLMLRVAVEQIEKQVNDSVSEQLFQQDLTRQNIKIEKL